MSQIIRSELRGVIVGFVMALAVVGLVGRWPSAQAAGGVAQPSQAAPGAEVPVPGGPGFLMIPAAAFVPNAFVTQSGIQPDGSLYSYSNGGFYTAPVFLPNKARVTKMTIYYYDNDPNAYARVTLSSLVQNSAVVTDMVELNTGNSAALDAYASKSSSQIQDPVVDVQSNVYQLGMYLPDTTALGALRMRAVRLDYEMNVSLPRIQR